MGILAAVAINTGTGVFALKFCSNESCKSAKKAARERSNTGKVAEESSKGNAVQESNNTGNAVQESNNTAQSSVPVTHNMLHITKLTPIQAKLTHNNITATAKQRSNNGMLTGATSTKGTHICGREAPVYYGNRLLLLNYD
jgi:hypothetical protein